jgi:inhibitor of cysteine peptidase
MKIRRNSFFNTLVGALLMLLMANVWCVKPIVMHLRHTDTTFQIILPANPSTGFKWVVTNYDRGLLKLVSSRYVASQARMPGAGGVMEYNFQLLPGVDVPKLTALIFTYERPWEKGRGIVQSVTVNFDSYQSVD